MKRLANNKVEFNVQVMYWHYQTTDSKGNPITDKVIIHYSDGEYSLISTVSMTPKEVETLDKHFKNRTKLRLELTVGDE